MSKKYKLPLILRCVHCQRPFHPARNNSRQKWCSHPMCQQDKKAKSLEYNLKWARRKRGSRPRETTCLNCKEKFKIKNKAGQTPLFCPKPECQKARKERALRLSRNKNREYASIARAEKEKLKQKKKRPCRSPEVLGFRPAGCHKYIDNNNYLYCSFCHSYISDKLDEVEDYSVII